MKKGVSPQQKQKMPSFTLWMLAAFSATLVITFWPRTSLTALDPTSLQNQRVIWEHALVNATQVSNHDVEGHNLLVYLKHQAIFTDGTKPLPSSLPDGCFHVVVLTQENDHPNAQWYEEVQRMKQGDVYASYHHDIKTILLRDRTVAGPIQGSILLHETLHAFHFNTKWKEHQLTPRESADEEIAAFTMQVRLFRKAYGKPYEALRASLFRLLNEDVQWRIKIARNADETVDASFPNPTLLTRVPMEKWGQAFAAGRKLSQSEIMDYANFSFVDVSLAVIDYHWHQDPKTCASIKAAFYGWIKYNSSSHHP